jgi:MSHA type pilus biogenesis protein MshL
MRVAVHVFIVLALSLVLAGCQSNKKEYLDNNLDYRDLTETIKKENRQFEQTRERERAMEKVSPEVVEAMEPVMPEYNPLDETTISINVQQESIHNILYIIARNAGLNLVIEPGISLENRTTISFENAVSSLVVERLLGAYDLAWEVEDNILYVHRWDEQVFDLDFINISSEATTSSGGDIFGSALQGGDGGGSQNLTGEFTMDSNIGGDFDENSLYGFILRSVDSIISEEDQFYEGGEEGDEEEAEDVGYFAVDPVAGRLFVRTTPGKLKAVARMLNNLKAKLSRQVVIDARLLEVELTDNFDLGIDWNYVTNRLVNGNLRTLNYAGHGQLDPNNTIVTFTSEFGDDDLTATIEALQVFGGVKALANPHIRVKHGQPALFSTGTSTRFVSELTRESDEAGNVLFTTTTSTVFNGVMLGVIAYVNDYDVIDLQIFPLQSEVDPDSLVLRQVTAAGDQLTLPEVTVKSIRSTLRISDGDTVILGGMIERARSKTDNEVPGVGQIPGLGWLFKNRAARERVTELVVIMTIRVVR